MSWARSALERNESLVVVAEDANNRVFTVRMKQTGELRTIGVDELVAGPSPARADAATSAGPEFAGDANTSAQQTPASAQSRAVIGDADSMPVDESAIDAEGADAGVASRAQNRTSLAEGVDAVTRAGESARELSSSTAAAGRAPALASASPVDGRVLAAGPGYSISSGEDARARSREPRTLAGPGYSVTSAAGSGSEGAEPATDSGNREADRAQTAAAALPVERRNEPLVCQGRFLQLDNRNLEFSGDGVSAEAGCELHLTNSRIVAKGVALRADNAQVHIKNSRLEGVGGSIEASGASQLYVQGSSFKGMSRRMDSASVIDQGRNDWN